MYRVELYARVRRACHVEGMSTREASRVFGVDRKTVRKMLSFSVPPGYRRSAPPRRPKLGPFTGIIDRILEDDRTSHRKQRHTAKRIFDRLRDEYGFTGGYTIVKDYVREQGLRSREVFVPLSHSPGHAQADFGEAMAVIGGALRKIHFLAFDLPHSDGCFVAAYPAETTEAFCDGHNAAFAFFGGVPRSILYDNTKLAVARILGDGKRQRTRVFTELQSHYLFEDRFGRPGKGNDKGKVEGLVGFIRRNFLVPVPRAESFAALNDALAEQCRRRQAARLRGHKETIGERLERDRQVLLPLPPAPYDACDKRPGRASSLSLVRYRGNDYSVPVAYGHREVLIRGYVDEVVISCGAEVIARHRRSYDSEDLIFDPLHYLPLIEQKIGALDQAAPLAGWDLPEAFITLRRLLEARMGKAGKREYVQVLRLLETFRLEEVEGAVGDALRLGAIGFLLIRDTPSEEGICSWYVPYEGGSTVMRFKVASRVRGSERRGVSRSLRHRGAVPLGAGPGRAGRTASSAPPAAIAGIVCWRAGASTNATGARSRHRSTAGTIFHATKLPLTLWFAAVHLIVTAKNGISSVELGRRLGVKQPTAWTMKHKIMAVMARREADTPLSGRVEMDDAYLGGVRAGGKRGRGAPGKTPFVAAVSTSPEGRPRKVKLVPVKGFRKREIARGAKLLAGPRKRRFVTDGLRCWSALDGVVGSHRAIRTGSGRQAARMAPFKWVNTTLGNIKSAITGTYRKLGPDHAQRYLASFAWRYNRRYQLNTMIPRFVHSAARTQPIPYRALIAG